MIKEALQYLISLGNVDVKEVGMQSFSTQPLHVIKAPLSRTITVNSLSGFVGYVKSGFDAMEHDNNLMIHVVSPTEVVAYSHLNNDQEREAYVKASAMLPSFRFGSFHDAESFNIALQSVFVTNEDRATMLKIVGNIKDENVASFGDDGVTQQVRTKSGVATVADVPVPNPVYLKPYRTFVELQQPESAFVFRMRSGPECALFEADGGAWKVEAMDKVRAFLEKELEQQIQSEHIVLIS
jgi:hypothetical protein